MRLNCDEDLQSTCANLLMKGNKRLIRYRVRKLLVSVLIRTEGPLSNQNGYNVSLWCVQSPLRKLYNALLAGLDSAMNFPQRRPACTSWLVLVCDKKCWPIQVGLDRNKLNAYPCVTLFCISWRSYTCSGEYRLNIATFYTCGRIINKHTYSMNTALIYHLHVAYQLLIYTISA